ncbi:MAG: DUF721 domain-containing protein [Desulfuromonas sp.]|nr:MAG: DUF721 domain-containing protein [Desulfuromonas sp.]
MSKPRRPPMKKAAHVGGLLDQLLAKLGLEERLEQAKALVIWESVVGPQIAAHTRPLKIRDGVIEVCVDQPVWMQQLQLMKPQILGKLNAALGEAPLRDIFLKRGKVTGRSGPSVRQSLPWQQVTLDGREKQEIEQMVEAICDPKLRWELESLLTRQACLAKAKNSGRQGDSA